VSDLTHSPLPSSVEEATARFLPPQRYREWKPQDRLAVDAPESIGGTSQDIVKHSRALTTHMLQEMGKGLLQEIHDKIANLPGPVEFWTSEEARERCMRIVTRIGGEREVHRAEALFPPNPLSAAEAEALFWQGSRYPRNFIPLLPIRLYPAPPLPPVEGAPEPHSRFFRSMTKVCQDFLAQDAVQAPASASNGRNHPPRNEGGEPTVDGDPQQTAGAKINSRLSPHAVKSMLRGAELGWTTLTTTKSSVKALLREIKAARLAGRLVEDVEGDSQTVHDTAAAIWIVDPRNLQCFV